MGIFGHVIEDITVMSFVKHHGDLVKIIAQFLNKIGLRNKKFRTADLGLVFNLVTQADYNNKITIPVDEQLVNRSSSSRRGGGGGTSIYPALSTFVRLSRKGQQDFPPRGKET